MSRCVVLFAFLVVLTAMPSPGRTDNVQVLVYPKIYNFPGQQLCQVDVSDRRYREFCAPQSYHPYGAFGYRPYGTYWPPRRVQPYRVAPSAKIIRLRPSQRTDDGGGP